MCVCDAKLGYPPLDEGGTTQLTATTTPRFRLNAAIVGFEIQCPRHGARFDVKTGKALCFPAFEPVATHQVEVRGDDVLVSTDG